MGAGMDATGRTAPAAQRLAVAAWSRRWSLAGCGSGDGERRRSQRRGGRGAGADGARRTATRPAGTGGAGAPDEAGAGAPDLRVDQRSIIYTGSITVQVDDVDAAARGRDRRGRPRPAASSAATSGAAPSADARGRAAAAGAGGEVHRRGRRARRSSASSSSAEINTEDVTEETVDLDARITTQQARVDSARRLLARATSISDLVSLENELAKREADLASLEAKKRRLADLTALSTITVSLLGPDAETAEEEDRDRLPGRARRRLEGVRRLAGRPAHRARARCCLAGGARRTGAGGAAGRVACRAAARPAPATGPAAAELTVPGRRAARRAGRSADGAPPPVPAARSAP